MTSKSNVEIVADTTFNGRRIVSIVIEMPRIILAQFNKHALIRSNTSSSRAVPVKRATAIIMDDPYFPEVMTKNESGMGTNNLVSDEVRAEVIGTLKQMLLVTEIGTARMAHLGLHKQHANRYLEPYSMVRITATGAWEAWEHLRWQRDKDDGTPQPEFFKVARFITEAIEASIPRELPYHVPYFDHVGELTREHVLYACGRAARESYRRDDVSAEFKDRLASLWQEGHATPFEHVCFYDHTDSTGTMIVNPLTTAYALARAAFYEKGVDAHYATDLVPDRKIFHEGWRQVRHIGFGSELDVYIAQVNKQ